MWLKACLVLFLWILKFIYSEKATKFWEISTLLLFYVVQIKSMADILQNFVAFLEYVNFKRISETFCSCVRKSQSHEFMSTLVMKSSVFMSDLNRAF